MDTKYEKADPPAIIRENHSHLTALNGEKLRSVLLKFESLFDGTVGDWKLPSVSFEPYHGRPYPILHKHKAILMKEIKWQCNIGVLEWQPSSRWVSPTFIIPKKDSTVQTISNFRELNKRIVRKPYPIPKINTILQELKGFTYATALDLNMGYYTIRLDPMVSKMCTIIFPWGKYSFKRLPMGFGGSADIFQAQIGIKPQPKKVQAILVLNPPSNIKELRNLLGMVQYYRDMWARSSELLAPLTDLVGECGETKTTRMNKTKKKPWQWDPIHQQAFDNVKVDIAKETVLARLFEAL